MLATKLTTMNKVLSAFFILFLFSCQKEIEPTQIEQEKSDSKCKLAISRTYSITGALMGDSAIYYYNGSKVHKTTGGDPADSVVFEYTGNNITKRRHISSGILIGYDDLVYNADGSLKAITTYSENPAIGGIELDDSTVFTYSAGKLSKRQYFSVDFQGQGQGLILEEENLFSFTGNNLTREITIRYNPSGSIDQTDTIMLQYDLQPNLLKKQGFPHLQANPMFWDSYAYFLAFLFSENNVISGMIANDPSSLELITYTKDTRGNVEQINQAGIPLLSYKYNCP